MPFPKAEHVDMQPHALHLDKSAGRRMGGLEPRYAEMGRRCEHGKEQGDNGEIKQDHRDQVGHRTLPAPRDEHSGTITGRSFGGSRPPDRRNALGGMELFRQARRPAAPRSTRRQAPGAQSTRANCRLSRAAAIALSPSVDPRGRRFRLFRLNRVPCGNERSGFFYESRRCRPRAYDSARASANLRRKLTGRGALSASRRMQAASEHATIAQSTQPSARLSAAED
jgi:hypothetical protein